MSGGKLPEWQMKYLAAYVPVSVEDMSIDPAYPNEGDGW